MKLGGGHLWVPSVVPRTDRGSCQLLLGDTSPWVTQPCLGGTSRPPPATLLASSSSSFGATHNLPSSCTHHAYMGSWRLVGCWRTRQHTPDHPARDPGRAAMSQTGTAFGELLR